MDQIPASSYQIPAAFACRPSYKEVLATPKHRIVPVQADYYDDDEPAPLPAKYAARTCDF